MIKNWLRALNRKRLQARKRRAMLRLSVDLIPECIPFIHGDINILTPPHTVYVAKQLREAFGRVGKLTQISIVKPEGGWRDGVWVVICPQAYEELPSRYIAYQFEQTQSSQHFTAEYLRRLKCAEVVWDYSKENVKFLIESGFDAKRIRHVPVVYALNPPCVEDVKKEYDVVFYGDVNNPRRRAIMDALAAQFRVLVVSGVYGSALYQKLIRAKCVLNIHYYEGALLETPRLYECLSMHLCVVSEKARDQYAHESLNDVVHFVDVGDVDGLIAAISELTKNDDSCCYKRQHEIHALMATKENFLVTQIDGLLKDIAFASEATVQPLK